MIEIRNLTKRFGSSTAVDDLSFRVDPGEVLGFLGPNGAGKSTTMKMITGFLAPTEGTVLVDGRDVAQDPLETKARIGYLPEGAPLYPDMTPRTMLDFVAKARGMSGSQRKSRIQAAIERVELQSVLDQRIETLSKGFKRRVGLAAAIVHDPPVLVLDEPTDGLDPNQKDHVRALIREMAAGKVIILSTHILEEVEAVCTRAIIIAKGRLLFDGLPVELRKRSRYHRAVELALRGNGDGVAERLRGVPGVLDIERQQAESGLCRFLVLPNSDANPFQAVLDSARDAGWEVLDFHVERGRMDDVFRDPRCPRGRELEAGRQRAEGGGVVKGTWTVFARELKGYFTTPVAFVFLLIFLILTGVFTWSLGDFYASDQADLQRFFMWHPWLYLALIPALSMRLWAEERRSGTIELLLTLPISMLGAVIGKFLAAWAFCGVALALTATNWVSVNYLGDPDNGVILASYIGSFLMAGAYLAIGAAMSSLSKNQVTAFVLSFTVCLIFVLAGYRPVVEALEGWTAGWFVELITNLSFQSHFDQITRGVLAAPDLVFFLSAIAVFLFANAVIVEQRKAS
jgi:ABC-2 type transport system ATP-binding protein